MANPYPVEESPAGPIVDRVISLAVIAVAVTFVVLLRAVPPDPRGYGTHELLGMDPCGWPTQLGIPCPTCGVTTAATHMVHLSPVRSFTTQPFGAVLTLFGLWLAGVALASLIRRRSFVGRLSTMRYGTGFVVGVVLLLGSWWYVYLTWRG